MLSLDSQESELLQLAQREGLEIVEVLKESKSAKAPSRPIFGEMMKKIDKGKADAILCWKIDRLTRNPVDGGQLQWLLQNGKIKCIRTFEKNFLPTDNVLLMSIEQAMASQYVRDLSENVKRGNRAKLEKGGWPSFAPIGYVNDKINKTLKVDKKIAPYILRAYELYATGGYSVQQVCDILYEDGLRNSAGKKMFKSYIYRFLSNKFYIGLMERQGKTYQGNHTPIVSVALFNKAQEVLNRNSHPHHRKNFYSARGFLTCNVCGCALTCDTKKGHQYYYCTNGKGMCTAPRKFMRSEYVDGLISTMFLKLQFDEEFIEISAEAYKQRNQGKISYVETAKENLLKELESLTEKESVLADTLLSKSIRKEIYDLKRREIENQRAILNQQIKEIERKGG
jgi:DNA invertase Pin-like site-specific DNA recombinase